MSCFVPYCTSTCRKNNDLRFHHFPTDPERCKEWIKACKRTYLIEKSPTYFRKRYVCSLHFEKTMYMNKYLLRSAVPSLQLGTTDSCTQTLEHIKFFRPSPYISEVPDSLLKRIELRTSHTQTEEFMFCANNNLEVKKENDIIYRPSRHIEEHELEVKHVLKNEEDETEMMADEISQMSTDSEQESEDETSEMSIDEFLRLNKGLENQIRDELRKQNIPQIPIQDATGSKDLSKIYEDETDSGQESEDETFQRNENETQSKLESEAEASYMSVDEFVLHLNEGLEKQIGKALKKENTPQISKKARVQKETQTDDVAIYEIPKNNLCFEQCLRCGKNASRIVKKYRNGKRDNRCRVITIQDFEKACEKYLSPMFCTTVKNQIKIEFLTKMGYLTPSIN